jgi:hypothetical protein
MDALVTGVPKYSEAAAFQELFFTETCITGWEGDLETLYLSIEITPIGYMHTAELEWADDRIATSQDGTRQTWVDKYITSPPITAAQISAYVQPDDHKRGAGWIYATIYDPHGITYGTTAEVLKKLRVSESVRPPEEKFFGWTSLSFVTEALAPGSTIAWYNSSVSRWDPSHGTEQQLSGCHHYEQQARLRTK